MQLESFTIPRSGQQPLKFSGEKLAEATSHEERKRWLNERCHEIALYRTGGGTFVLHIGYRGRKAGGEQDHDHVATYDTIAAVAAALQGHDAVLRIQGFPSGIQFDARQAQLEAVVRRGYEEAVKRLLLSDEFAVEIK